MFCVNLCIYRRQSLTSIRVSFLSDIICDFPNADYSPLSGSMSDAAKSTWSTAEITTKCTTTDRALQERLSAVENAQTEDRHTKSNQESVKFEMTAWEVQLLAGGGYNYVWLVCYTVTHRVSSLAFPPLLQTNCFKRCRTVPRHFCLKKPSSASPKRKRRHARLKKK